jgi:uncharacterized protein
MKLVKKLKNSRQFWRAEHFVYLTLAAAFLIFGWWLVGLNYVNHRSLSGQTAGSSQASQLFYKSLDLSLVRRAEFSSQKIKQLNLVGADAQTRRYIFSFGVPHDNLVEKGLLDLPAQAPPKNGFPVIILCHGYSNPWSYSTERGYLGDMEFYASHGFAVLKPDFRGQGLSIPDGQPEGAYYSMAYNTDVMSLIAAVKKTSYLNAQDINLWGHSMGAYIALRAGVISPDVKKVILLSGPVASFSNMYQQYVAVSDSQNPTAANIRLDAIDRYGSPLTNPDFWDKASPINYLGDTKAAIQIHVGSNDRVVPPFFSAQLDAELTKLHKKHEYYVYPGGNHGLGPESPLVWQRSLDFLQTKN